MQFIMKTEMQREWKLLSGCSRSEWGWECGSVVPTFVTTPICRTSLSDTEYRIWSRCSYTYRFYADVPGTHWYHGHLGTDRGTGLVGAFIVKRDEEERFLVDGALTKPNREYIFLMQVKACSSMRFETQPVNPSATSLPFKEMSQVPVLNRLGAFLTLKFISTNF
jgi:hypothetical protein